MTSAFGTNRISGLRGNALDVAFVGNTSPNFMDVNHGVLCWKPGLYHQFKDCILFTSCFVLL